MKIDTSRKNDPLIMLAFTSAAAFAVLLFIAALGDLRTRNIPNELTVGGLVLGLMLRSFLGSEALIAGLLGAALAFLIMMPLFALQAVGGGDAKLMITVGAFLAPGGLLIAVLATALIGGVMSVVVAVRGGVIAPLLLNTSGLAKWAFTLGRRGERRTLQSPGAVSIPYGVAIAVGSMLALLMGGGPI